MSEEQEFDPQEFRDADEAVEWLIEGAKIGLLSPVAIPAYVAAVLAKAYRAQRWLAAAVEYAQERGWPDRPMLTRREGNPRKCGPLRRFLRRGYAVPRPDHETRPQRSLAQLVAL